MPVAPPLAYLVVSLRVLCSLPNPIFKHDRQCTYNVTLRRVRATIVAVENNKYYICRVCVCSHECPACNANAPYCSLWHVRLYHILPHYLIHGKRQDFRREKKLPNTKCVLIFYTSFVWNISHSRKNSARYNNKCISVIINTFAASYLNTQGLNNSYLKSPASSLVDLTFQPRALRSFSLNQLRNLSL